MRNISKQPFFKKNWVELVLQGGQNMNKELKRLKPIGSTIYNDRVNSIVGQLGDMTEKRVGGGRAQFGYTTFAELATTIVSCEKGFDKQKRVEWSGKEHALRRIFSERGWPTFDKAILIAVIRKYNEDPKDGFIPLAPGTIDIEASLTMEDIVHKEALVFGEPRPSNNDENLAKAISEIIGLTTEYGNGNSIEIVVPMLTPGIWQKVEDIEFGRPAGAIVASPYLTLYCEGMDINNLQTAPRELLSVKAVEAIKIAKHLCKKCDIK